MLTVIYTHTCHQSFAIYILLLAHLRTSQLQSKRYFQIVYEFYNKLSYYVQYPQNTKLAVRSIL